MKLNFLFEMLEHHKLVIKTRKITYFKRDQRTDGDVVPETFFLTSNNLLKNITCQKNNVLKVNEKILFPLPGVLVRLLYCKTPDQFPSYIWVETQRISHP